MVGSSYGMIVPTLRKLNQTSVNSWDVYIMQSPQSSNSCSSIKKISYTLEARLLEVHLK